MMTDIWTIIDDDRYMDHIDDDRYMDHIDDDQYMAHY